MKCSKPFRAAGSLLVLSVISTPPRQVSAQTQMSDYVIGTGATATSAGNVWMVGTFGQPAIGIIGTVTQLQSAGFWARISTGTMTSIERLEEESLPIEFRLHDNYPNPFNPTTTIQFDVPERTAVRLVVYDLLGKVVAALVDAELDPGRYRASWDAADEYGRPVASGTYIYRLETLGYASTGTMTLLK